MGIYDEAERIVSARRTAREEAQRDRLETAMKNADFAENEYAIRGITPLLAKCEVTGDTDGAKKLMKKADTLQKKRAKLLKSMNLDEAYFTLPPFCSVCKDTGFHQGRACKCLRQVICGLIERESGLTKRTLHTFEQFDENVFDEKDRERAKMLRDKMLMFAEKFPEVKRRNILFMGESGTGKTFLTDNIASKLSERGITVLYSTAFSLNNLFLKYHTTFDGDKGVFLDNLTSCDVLIIDDLGTEPILKNVTKEYLFSVVNERKIAQKSTIVSTNLNLEQLTERYGERIVSRIYDKGDGYLVRFDFGNLRKKR